MLGGGRKYQVFLTQGKGEVHILRINSLESARKDILGLPNGKQVRGGGKNWGIRLRYTSYDIFRS